MEVSTDASYSFTVTANRTLVAHFAINQYSAIAAADPPAGGTITGESIWSDTGGGVGSYYICTLAWDGTGLYAGIYNHGVWRYDPATSVWSDTGGGVGSYYIYSLAWDGSSLYAGTDGHGTWRYDPATSVWSDTGGGVGMYSICSLAWDGSSLYAGTDGHGTWRYDPATSVWSDTGGGVGSYYIYSLAWDGSCLYAGTDGHGTWRYDPATSVWSDTGGGVGMYSICSLAWDGTGLYAGTYNHGVWRYDPATSVWSDTGGGVSGYEIESLAWDGTGLYAGTYNHGVWRYDPATSVWSDTGGVINNDNIHSMVWDGSSLYAGPGQLSVWRYHTYAHGQMVDLVASPDTANGYHFVNWTEGASEISTSAAYSFTITASRALVAHFALNTYTIAVSADPPAGGSISGAGTYNYGQTVYLVASNATGYHFVNWTEGGSVVPTPYICTFTVTADRTLVAHFALNTYTISATADPPPATGNITGAGTYTHGDAVNLSASPGAVYHFVNWTEGGVEVSTSATYSFTATRNRNLIAHFALNTYAVNASVTGEHGTVTEATQTVNYGASATVHITPEAGYHIASITDNGAAKAIANPYVITNVTATHTVVVTFAQDRSPDSIRYLAGGLHQLGLRLLREPSPTPTTEAVQRQADLHDLIGQSQDGPTVRHAGQVPGHGLPVKHPREPQTSPPRWSAWRERPSAWIGPCTGPVPVLPAPRPTAPPGSLPRPPPGTCRKDRRPGDSSASC